ncbi:MAG: hypothetical protein ACJA1M_000544 [Alphaproteobacteria bacterium]|jgi:hypothetical protein
MKSSDINYYTDTLDAFYQNASQEAKQSEAGYSQEVDKKRAKSIIKELNIEFGDYKDIFIDAIIGMTEIEAFIYLNQVLSELDAADGIFDGVIDLGEDEGKGKGKGKGGDAFEDLMLKSVFADNTSEKSEGKKGKQSDDEHDAIQEKLMAAAEIFKQDDNPTDTEYIDRIEKRVIEANSPESTQSVTTIHIDAETGDTTITIEENESLQQKTADFNNDGKVSTAEALAFYGLDTVFDES